MGRPRPEEPEPAPSPRPDRRSVALHLLPAALFLLCAAAWSLAIPPFESPDEIGHARYVNAKAVRAAAGRQLAQENNFIADLFVHDMIIFYARQFGFQFV